jgi:hypothetical protein
MSSSPRHPPPSSVHPHQPAMDDPPSGLGVVPTGNGRRVMEIPENPSSRSRAVRAAAFAARPVTRRSVLTATLGGLVVAALPHRRGDEPQPEQPVASQTVAYDQIVGLL